jgi:hypothetical protein
MSRGGPQDAAVAGELPGRRGWGNSIKDASVGPLVPKRLQRQVLAEREPVGGEERRKERGLQLLGIPPCFARGLRWTSGGGGQSLFKGVSVSTH